MRIDKNKIVSHEEAQRRRRRSDDAKNELNEAPDIDANNPYIQMMRETRDRLPLANNGYEHNEALKAKLAAQKQAQSQKQAKTSSKQSNLTESIKDLNKKSITAEKEKDDGGLEM